MMKQHAEQVNDLRADKRELDGKIERQAELLSATLEVGDVILGTMAERCRF